MSNTTVRWHDGNWENVFKTSKAIGAALQKRGDDIATRNSILARQYAHGSLKEAYKCEVRVLDHTQVAVVHSTNKITAAIGRAHGLPRP